MFYIDFLYFHPYYPPILPALKAPLFLKTKLILLIEIVFNYIIKVSLNSINYSLLNIVSFKGQCADDVYLWIS